LKDDIDDRTVLIRGADSEHVQRSLQLPLFDTQEEKLWKKPPAMALSLEHIYGVSVADLRGSIMYSHVAVKKEKKNNFGEEEKAVDPFAEVDELRGKGGEGDQDSLDGREGPEEHRSNWKTEDRTFPGVRPAACAAASHSA
jgi:hypothetical protein